MSSREGPRPRASLHGPARQAPAISLTSSSTDFSFARADDRHDEAVVGLHSDPDVVAVEIDDRVAVESRVQLRELGERVGACLHDGREQTVERNALEVALLDPRHRRHLAMRARHVLGDHPADASQRLATPLGRGARGGGAHVVLGDPPTRA